MGHDLSQSRPRLRDAPTAPKYGPCGLDVATGFMQEMELDMSFEKNLGSIHRSPDHVTGSDDNSLWGKTL